ncbi:GTPase-associated protein 1-related protein [Streptomyces sp. NPDC007088]|uniref:GTPase-associated protein 1-related protein n=1 Tax=Streptomyces sp. NPDC007088 TaxID=3364773 RepID=UPI0036A0DA58
MSGERVPSAGSGHGPVPLRVSVEEPGQGATGRRVRLTAPGAAGVDPPPAVLEEAGTLLGHLVAPPAVPRRATAEAGAPVSFSVDQFADGGMLLSWAAHAGPVPRPLAVYLPPGAGLPAGLPPVAFRDAVRPVRGAAAEEGLREALLAAPPDGSPDAEALADFAASRRPWLAAFLAHVRWVLVDPGAPRLVVVERDPALVARWIMLACAVLPPRRARRLTFTTYSPCPGRASQRIVGTGPQEAGGPDPVGEGRYVVLDCTSSPVPAPGTAHAGSTGADVTGADVTGADAWAEVAAFLWRVGRPEVAAAARPALDADALRLAALASGVRLPAHLRAATAEHLAADSPKGIELAPVAAVLCAEPPETRAEAVAVARWYARLDARAPLAVTAPVAASVLTALVRGQLSGTPVPSGSALTEEHRERLRALLGPEVRLATADPATAPRRCVGLLQVAAVLGVDCGPALGGVADRLAAALTTNPGPDEDPVAAALPSPEALAELPELRAALLPRLDAFACADPAAASALLHRVRLPLDSARPAPHLRMCAEAETVRASAPDPVTAWEALLAGSRPSWSARPSLLRTALRLIWPGQPPTASETVRVLHTAGSDGHRAAGTWRVALDVALHTPVTEPYDFALAPLLLRFFPDRIHARERSALLLLELAHDVRAGRASDWAEHAVRLRRAAEPLEPEVRVRAYRALAEALLRSPGTPEGELYGLAHSGDGDLVTAYGETARTEEFRALLRERPGLIAGCFVDWTAHTAADPTWREVSTGLLDDVLRPVVRALPAQARRAAEEHLAQAGRHRADAFRAWARPGALGRLGRRLSAAARNTPPREQ